jgi:hypothetical protein
MKQLLLPILLGLSLTACAGEKETSKTAAPEPAPLVTETVVSEVPPVVTKIEAELRPLLDGQKMARCVIGPDKYEGPCTFLAGSNGSFSISRRDHSIIFSNVTVVSVSIIEKGKAEVRGLTTEGFNSRWGPATRSKEDPACWVGSDFKVCAY